jgi:hypothetical protein
MYLLYSYYTFDIVQLVLATNAIILYMYTI